MVAMGKKLQTNEKRWLTNPNRYWTKVSSNITIKTTYEKLTYDNGKRRIFLKWHWSNRPFAASHPRDTKLPCCSTALLNLLAPKWQSRRRVAKDDFDVSSRRLLNINLWRRYSLAFLLFSNQDWLSDIEAWICSFVLSLYHKGHWQQI